MGVSEFCEVMDLSRSTVHKLIRDGKIRSAKVYGKRIIDASEPERLLSGEAV
jgi:excisionase family DNA binding protein